MSLSIALQQIQLPTWWTFEEKKHGGYQPLPQVADRRAKIVAFLEPNTGRVTTDDLMAITGATRSQVNKTMGDLLTKGWLKKVQ